MPPCVSSDPDALPEATSSKTGVSVRYAHDPEKSWFVFRASYSREDRAFDYMVEDGTYPYIAKRLAFRTVNGKVDHFLQPLIPNIIFAYTTKRTALKYTRHTPELRFLHFYFNRLETKPDGTNPPLTIPHREMRNFIQATKEYNEHVMSVTPRQCHYRGDDIVRVKEGAFKGVVGKVARVAGQQRVVLKLTEFGLFSTAYIPSAFIEKLPPPGGHAG